MFTVQYYNKSHEAYAVNATLRIDTVCMETCVHCLVRNGSSVQTQIYNYID